MKKPLLSILGLASALAFTMPIWATMIAAVVLHEPLSRRKLFGLALGAAGMAVLLGDQIGIMRKAPLGALMTTRLAPPARCLAASPRAVNKPVDSITM